MASIKLEFAGIKLSNPIIAASAPPTENLTNILKCAEAGIGAVVTKTSANYDQQSFFRGGRRTWIDRRGMWAQGTFRRETLSLNEGKILVSEAVKYTNIPIIASVGNFSKSQI
jgi:hypothetical protein